MSLSPNLEWQPQGNSYQERERASVRRCQIQQDFMVAKKALKYKKCSGAGAGAGAGGGGGIGGGDTCKAWIAQLVWNKVAGIVYSWIRLSNPWIHIESWIMNPDLVCIVDHESGFSLYRGSEIQTWKDSFQVVDHRSSQFSKDLTWFQESNKSSWIFSTIVWNKFHTLKRTYLRFLANSR